MAQMKSLDCSPLMRGSAGNNELSLASGARWNPASRLTSIRRIFVLECSWDAWSPEPATWKTEAPRCSSLHRHVLKRANLTLKP